MKVGICGTGRMGGAMATRLLTQGQSVEVWNRSAERAEPLLTDGATMAATPAELMEHCDLVICMLFDVAAQMEVYHGVNGLLAKHNSNALIVDMSTMTPDVARSLAQDVTTVGIGFLECPVGGTVAPALNGKLLGMAGGDAKAFEQARPVLEQLCRRVEHVGNAGAGAALKLAINLPLATYWESLGEALSLAIAGGVDPEQAGSILADSSGAISVAAARIPLVLSAIGKKPDELGSFDVSSVVKDISLMREFANSADCELPLADAAFETYSVAEQQGWGKNDAAAMAAWRCRANDKRQT